MGRTKIEWTRGADGSDGYTWNPVVGCTKVSQGCKLCYAKTIHDMRHKAFLAGKAVAPQYSMPFEMVQLMPDRLTWPLSLRQPSRIFVNSVSDLFHEDVPDEFIDQVFAVMALADRHTFQVLTKRPKRMLEYLTDETLEARRGHLLAGVGERIALEMFKIRKDAPETPWPLPNVWLGTSVENQEAADERIRYLLETPAAVRFISGEPLLGAVDLTDVRRHDGWRINALTGEEFLPGEIVSGHLGKIDWVIAGGESGSSKQSPRPMHPDWARSLRDQCVAAGVPFLFKQWGEWGGLDNDGIGGNEEVRNISPSGDFVQSRDDSIVVVRIGKKNAGRQLDGRTWDEFPKAEVKTS
jgi:protein gp37